MMMLTKKNMNVNDDNDDDDDVDDELDSMKGGSNHKFNKAPSTTPTAMTGTSSTTMASSTLTTMTTSNKGNSKSKFTNGLPSSSSSFKYNNNTRNEENNNSCMMKIKKRLGTYSLWESMIAHPLPYLIIIPVIYILLIGIGFTQEKIIEDSIAAGFIPQRNDYMANIKYVESLSNGTTIEELKQSAMSAMTIFNTNNNNYNKSNDNNLFTSKHLEEIRTRMEQTESTVVTYKGMNYTWDDMCSINPAPYEYPCVRLTPMDLFYEARWFFDDVTSTTTTANEKEQPSRNARRLKWYDEITKSLKIPIFSRFHILSATCTLENGNTNVCTDLINYRTVETDNVNALFGDLTQTLEMSDDCRICIETNYERTIRDWYDTMKSSFTVLYNEIQKHIANNSNNISSNPLVEMLQMNQLLELSGKVSALLQTISYNDIQEFHYYYSIRFLYAELGYVNYMEAYNGRLQELLETCVSLGPLLGLTYCPPMNVTKEEARTALLNHADNTFSNISTAGISVPMWSNGDGSGSLFKGNHPVGGSGINMSGMIDSMMTYFDVDNYNTTNVWSPVYGADGYINTASSEWYAMVETNPLYAWFMAGLAPADQFCGNGDLTGTSTGSAMADNRTKEIFVNETQRWCNEYTIPNADNRGDGNYTKQYFAKMWFELLLDSSAVLDLQKGYDDPYSWTTGVGCGYELGGSRHNYTNMTEESILYNASRELYFWDEGTVYGAVSRELLLGDVTPSIGSYSFSNPLQQVGAIQTFYIALTPALLLDRVQNCKRPGGAVYNLTIEDAEAILTEFKEAMELTWSQGWDDPENDLQFVSFFDGVGSHGTSERMLLKITTDNTTLTALSIILIAAFSVIFLVSCDPIESRVLISLVAVVLVLLGYYAALGFSILIGIKVNITIAWTLPFIIMGLGVDDMYIVLMALRKQRGFSKQDFLEAMKEVVVPVTMTSLVNASMFAIMNLSDIPAVYQTARVAVYCIISLYIGVIFCFPAFCYLDMRRQAAGRYDVIMCCKKNKDKEPNRSLSSFVSQKHVANDYRSTLLYDYFFKPIVLGENKNIRFLSNTVLMLTAIGLVVVGSWGITKRAVGMGLEDFFPSNTQAGVWARKRVESLAPWSIGLRWGDNDYTDPNIQMQMLKQFEDVAATNNTAKIDTKRVWIAEFALWSSRLCEANVESEFDQKKCGYDQVFVKDNSVCSATWKVNTFDLRQKIFSDYDDQTCNVYEGGICRPISRMHPDDITDIMISDPTIDITSSTSFCPTIDNWSDDKWQFCLMQWRNLTDSTNGHLLIEDGKGSKTDCDGVYNNDQRIVWPIKYSSGPTMYVSDLFTHEDILKMMAETRQYCDYHETIHCWMQGIPFAFWTQYETIEKVLFELCAYSTAIGFVISFLFLFIKIYLEGVHERPKVLAGCLIGASLITLTCVVSLISVVGLSILAGVNLTGYSNMSFVLSVGFSVEYSVHIVSRWLRADLTERTSLDRVRDTMSFLMMPSVMSFVSSTIGVVCLAFTQFEYINIFFFRPLIIVMFVTYFFGCWWLPAFLTFLDCEVVKLGKAVPAIQIAKSSLSKKADDEIATNSKDNEQPTEPTKSSITAVAPRRLSQTSTFLRDSDEDESGVVQ